MYPLGFYQNPDPLKIMSIGRVWFKKKNCGEIFIIFIYNFFISVNKMNFYYIFVFSFKNLPLFKKKFFPTFLPTPPKVTIFNEFHKKKGLSL